MWAEDMSFMQLERPGRVLHRRRARSADGHGAAPQRALRHRRARARRRLSNDAESGAVVNSDCRRYVIIGNGFAGTTAAGELRKHDPSCEIMLFADEPYTLYNRISLPPMLRRQMPEAKVMMRNLAWHEEHRIDLQLQHARRKSRRREDRAWRKRPASVSVRCVADRHRRPPESAPAARRRRGGNRLSTSSISTIRAPSREAIDRGEGGRCHRRLVHRLRAGRSVCLTQASRRTG